MAQPIQIPIPFRKRSSSLSKEYNFNSIDYVYDPLPYQTRSLNSENNNFFRSQENTEMLASPIKKKKSPLRGLEPLDLNFNNISGITNGIGTTRKRGRSFTNPACFHLDQLPSTPEFELDDPLLSAVIEELSSPFPKLIKKIPSQPNLLPYIIIIGLLMIILLITVVIFYQDEISITKLVQFTFLCFLPFIFKSNLIDFYQFIKQFSYKMYELLTRESLGKESKVLLKELKIRNQKLKSIDYKNQFNSLGLLKLQSQSTTNSLQTTTNHHR